MSSPDSVQPVALRPVLTVVPPPPSARVRVRAALEQLPPAALGAIGIVAVMSVAFVAGRVLAVNLRYDLYIDSTETARALGAVSFLSIVAIAAAIGFGHRGLRAIPASQSLSRHVATVALGVAYLHLLLWCTRAISASVASTSVQSASAFLPNVFWWG
jgi:hypothetical protein